MFRQCDLARGQKIIGTSHFEPHRGVLANAILSPFKARRHIRKREDKEEPKETIEERKVETIRNVLKKVPGRKKQANRQQITLPTKLNIGMRAKSTSRDPISSAKNSDMKNCAMPRIRESPKKQRSYAYTGVELKNSWKRMLNQTFTGTLKQNREGNPLPEDMAFPSLIKAVSELTRQQEESELYFDWYEYWGFNRLKKQKMPQQRKGRALKKQVPPIKILFQATIKRRALK